jgi:hypothetical protein
VSHHRLEKCGFGIIKKEKRQSKICSASKSEAPLNVVIFTVAAYPNEGERDSGKSHGFLRSVEVG